MEARLTAPASRREGGLALLALFTILAVTAAWWALALWPLSAGAPGWVLVTRAACFGAAADGLPHAGGWILLVGEPVAMVGFLAAVWGSELRAGLRRFGSTRLGRGALALAVLAVALGLGAAGRRVARAAASGAGALSAAEAAGLAPVYVGRPAPPLALVDQDGAALTLERFRGRPVLLAFAYAHCETVCPLIVRDVLEAQAGASDARAAVVVVTLDPWRDTPSRLPHVARSWGMGADAHLGGGPVGQVERVLDAWNVARQRDPRTGEIVHPTSVYVIDRAGRIAYVVPARAEAIARALGRL